MFKSTDKTALQEIGPRFTLRLRNLRNGLPTVNTLGVPMKPLEIAEDPLEEEAEDLVAADEVDADGTKESVKKPKKSADGEYVWAWNVSLIFSDNSVAVY